MAGEEEQLRELLWSLVEWDLGLWPEDEAEVAEIAAGLSVWIKEREVSAKVGVIALAMLLAAWMEQVLAEETVH